jgi:hypothetical protein
MMMAEKVSLLLRKPLAISQLRFTIRESSPTQPQPNHHRDRRGSDRKEQPLDKRDLAAHEP